MTVQAYVERTNVQNDITAKIIAQLETGVRPWSKSWKSGVSEKPTSMFSMPCRFNGEPYSGINILLCWSAMEANGWTNKRFMTFDQAKQLGGFVRKGSKATKVVYYSTFVKETDKGEENIPYMKTYSVFNAQQIDGLPSEYYDVSEMPSDEYDRKERLEYVDQFFGNLGVNVRHGGDRAYYSPASDFVAMPSFGAFDDAAAYYATLGHEMAHATGHSSRLDRVFGKRFGDQAYAFEELVAELSAAFLCAELGITNEPRDDHASYLASWIKVLRTDSKAIFTAASQASKAVAFMRERQGLEMAKAA